MTVAVRLVLQRGGRPLCLASSRGLRWLARGASARRMAHDGSSGWGSSFSVPNLMSTRSRFSAERPEPKVDVTVSEERHAALLSAEIVHYSHAFKPHPLTLHQIIAQKEPRCFEEFLFAELPIRWARRLQLFETMPAYVHSPELREAYGLYREAFFQCRNVPCSSSAGAFRRALEDVKIRNAEVVMLMMRGTMALKEAGVVEASVLNQFLHEFLTARVGTDILTSQFLAVTSEEGPKSVIDPKCDAVQVVKSAAGDAQRLCRYHYRCTPEVVVQPVGQVTFPFIPQYLHYIMFEVLKNSLRAVAERHGRLKVKDVPVGIVVSGDDESVVIRVKDLGGGIPLKNMGKVWSYLYTTAKPQASKKALSSRRESTGDFLDDDGYEEEDVAPMAGFGVGLPLSRTYTSYAGGTFELFSMPNYGTSAYIVFNHVGNAAEVIGEAGPFAEQKPAGLELGQGL